MEQYSEVHSIRLAVWDTSSLTSHICHPLGRRQVRHLRYRWEVCEKVTLSQTTNLAASHTRPFVAGPHTSVFAPSLMQSGHTLQSSNTPSHKAHTNPHKGCITHSSTVGHIPPLCAILGRDLIIGKCLSKMNSLADTEVCVCACIGPVINGEGCPRVWDQEK